VLAHRTARLETIDQISHDEVLAHLQNEVPLERWVPIFDDTHRQFHRQKSLPSLELEPIEQALPHIQAEVDVSVVSDIHLVSLHEDTTPRIGGRPHDIGEVLLETTSVDPSEEASNLCRTATSGGTIVTLVELKKRSVCDRRRGEGHSFR